jgi:hypothetical protein
MTIMANRRHHSSKSDDNEQVLSDAANYSYSDSSDQIMIGSFDSVVKSLSIITANRPALPQTHVPREEHTKS